MTNEKVNEILSRYDAEAKSAVAAFKAAYDSLIERKRKYGTPVEYEIDELKKELRTKKANIQQRYESEVKLELSKAKSAALSSASISRAEREAVSDFIDQLRLDLAISGPTAVISKMEGMREAITDKQAGHIMREIGADLAKSDADVRYIASIYADQSALSAYETISALEAASVESATLPFDNFERSGAPFRKPMEPSAPTTKPKSPFDKEGDQ